MSTQMRSTSENTDTKLPQISTPVAISKSQIVQKEHNLTGPNKAPREAALSPLKHSVYAVKSDRQRIDQDIHAIINRVHKLALEQQHVEHTLQETNKRALEIYNTKQIFKHQRFENKVRMIENSKIPSPKERFRQEIKKNQMVKELHQQQKYEETQRMKMELDREFLRKKQYDQFVKNETRKKYQSIKEFEKNLQQKNQNFIEEKKNRVIEDSLVTLEKEKAITRVQQQQLEYWRFMEFQMKNQLNQEKAQAEQTHQFLEDSQLMPMNKFEETYSPESLKLKQSEDRLRQSRRSVLDTSSRNQNLSAVYDPQSTYQSQRNLNHSTDDI